MRLSEYILTKMEDILVEWESFAKLLYPTKANMSSAGLRDHAKQILHAVAADLVTEQSAEEQKQKSKGLAFKSRNAPETAAQTHAVLRAQSGMDINQLAAEYRALRASVLRLWKESCNISPADVEDVLRFNEAIDQALAESISYFSDQVDRSRNLLLGMLGHDMRSPLNAITLNAEHLASLNAGREISEVAESLIICGESMKSLLDDLVDFSRRNLGLGISIDVSPVELGKICVAEVKLHGVAYPKSVVNLTLEGDLQGNWDGQRLQQVLRNLLTNASAYGTPGVPVGVLVHGNENSVCIEVRNAGPPIAPEVAERIFDPLKRGSMLDSQANQKGMGLGLYIVREISRAHGGDVELESNDQETKFSVRLPRAP